MTYCKVKHHSDINSPLKSMGVTFQIGIYAIENEPFGHLGPFENVTPVLNYVWSRTVVHCFDSFKLIGRTSRSCVH